MFTFSPNQSAATKSSMEFVASLLAVLADPKATKQALGEMKQALGDLEVSHADLAAKIKAAQDQHAAEEAALDERHADLEKREAALRDIDAAAAAAGKRKDDAETAERLLDGKRQELNRAEDDLQRRQNAIAAREQAASKKETALAERERALADAEHDYRNRMTQLKALAG